MRRKRLYATEYWRIFELRALSFLVAVAAIGYSATDAPGLSTGDAITYAVSAWVIGMALLWVPRENNDEPDRPFGP